MLEEGDVVMIDGGTTTYQLCEFIALKRIRIITNSLVIAQAVDDVVSTGVSYFSSAGNDARDSYESVWRTGQVRAPGSIPSSGGGPAFQGGTTFAFRLVEETGATIAVFADGHARFKTGKFWDLVRTVMAPLNQ